MIDPRRETASTLRTAYSLDPNDGVYSREALLAGENLLWRCGLIGEYHDTVRATRQARALLHLPERDALTVLLEMLLRHERPAWLSSAASGVLRWEYVPDEAAARLTDLVPDLRKRELFLLGAAQHQEQLRLLGEAGEEHVAAACRSLLEGAGRPDLADAVIRVSEISDHFGYDILSPDLRGMPLHLEVKTQGRRADPARIYLTRNEAHQGSRDPCWFLVLCERTAEDAVQVRGWCRYDLLLAALPEDRQPAETSGRWTLVELLIPTRHLTPGLPLSCHASAHPPREADVT